MKMNSKYTIGMLSMALLGLTGCKSPVPTSGNLTQAPPREIHSSLELPDFAQPGPVVPGLQQGAIPQGLEYVPGKNLLLTSHYFDQEAPSCMVSIDWKTGKALHTVRLKNPDGSEHSGHVGGIALDSSSKVWMASDRYLYRFDLVALLMNDTVTAETRQRTEATHEAAFCTFYEDKVWVGEFALPKKYPTDPSHHLTARDGDVRHGWVCGYDLEMGFSRPQQVLSIPDRAQGMEANADYIFLSRSYGRRNRSTLDIYQNPLKEKAHASVNCSTGRKVDLWYLDGENHVRSIDLPPMCENVRIIDGKLVALFESGARKFQFFGRKPLDYIILLDLEELN